jgi:uncharacterized protein YecE (DUF72 family)
LTQYLIGTGGWAYFNASKKPLLKEYSKVFNFVEANNTFYEYPDTRTVERWRRTVPKDFTFTVRCNQDLTHRIGLRPVDEAYEVFAKMIVVCRILDAPFLHLETPASYVLDEENLEDAEDFLSAVDFKSVRLAWEIRSPVNEEALNFMRDFNIVQSVDLSKEEPAFKSDTVYTRLFGKGKHNIYQFTDDELEEIDQKILKLEVKKAIISFHGIKMNTDAIRFKQYKKTGVFSSATLFTGINSAKAVLSEDAKFPSKKTELIEHQGWKVIDLAANTRIHLSELLTKVPERTYHNLDELIQAMEASA